LTSPDEWISAGAVTEHGAGHGRSRDVVDPAPARPDRARFPDMMLPADHAPA
jgi:hypothetical protein